MIFFWRSPTRSLQHVAPGDVTWLAVTISTVQYLDMLPNVRLETHARDKVQRASWGLKGDEARWDIWHGERHRAGRSAFVRENFFSPFFFYAHLSMQAMIEGLKREALKGSAGVTTLELGQEGRALEWLRASLLVLTRAVERCEVERDKLLQAAFFLGQQNASSTWMFRAVVFNLDLSAAFDADGTLGVVVFDDKNLGHGLSRTPVLEAQFRTLKPPVIDEFIRLSEKVIKTCEARFS